jgi:NTE family protein
MDLPLPRNPSDEQTVLVLQGGGALGAYQAGVYEALADAGHRPDWVSGISVGAINAALIAGNPPERRVEILRAFWDRISATLQAPSLIPGEQGREMFNEASAAWAAAFGVPGFFTPRVPHALAFPPGAPEALSIYDTAPLHATLENLIDFDLINEGPIRLSVEAVDLRTGNFAYFDNRKQTIGPEHIMASAALPPGFPPVEIDGQHFWDGGLVSNTPLRYVLEETPRPDMIVFQVDLFSARGPMPRTINEVAEREKDIRFSSRTRLNTDDFRRTQTMRRAVHRLLDKLPDSMRDDPDVRILNELQCNAAVTIVQLIHRRKNHFTQSKDYEFSRQSIGEHWSAGIADARQTLQHKAWRKRKRPEHGVVALDLTRETTG